MQGDTENSWFFDESRRRFEIKRINIIFVQKLISALNRPVSHAPYFKFTEKSIKYLVSYGHLK